MIYYLSLGANLGNREQTISRALEQLEQHAGKVLRCSNLYYSSPWGFESVHDFCNVCCAVVSELSPLEMLHATQAVERTLGRTHKTLNGHYQDRTIDIDLIRAFDDAGNEIHCLIPNDQSSVSDQQSPISNVPLLSLPHPLWQQRDFVRIPLSEILDIDVNSL